MYSLFQRFCSYEMDQDDINRVAHEGFINLWCVVCGKDVSLEIVG